MIIINADDLGRTSKATDRSLNCQARGRITSASLMVHMADSVRASEFARSRRLDTGLHLNLDLPLDSPGAPPELKVRQLRIAGYFSNRKWAQVIYNPFIKKDIEYVFWAQFDEYRRLLGADPQRVDGHHHLHLCLNILADRVLPYGLRVRRNFTFDPGEKSRLNRTYRRAVDRWLQKRYICTNAFFSLAPHADGHRLARIMGRARQEVVELMVHPEVDDQYGFLMSDRFERLLSEVPTGAFELPRAANSPA